MAKARRFTQSSCVGVRSVYENFLRNATTLLGKHGVALDTQTLAERLSVDLTAVDKIKVETKRELGLWISGLPRYKGIRSHVIDVCLSLIQEVGLDSRGNEVLSASNIHVSYFERKRPGRFKILESWHYDYAPDKAGHPVFHAQLTGDHCPPPSATCSYHPAHRAPELKDLPRIPTAPLDLASVLEMLAADHLDYCAIVDDDSWRKTAESLPRIPMDHLIASRHCSDKLRPRHWYPTP